MGWPVNNVRRVPNLLGGIGIAALALAGAHENSRGIHGNEAEILAEIQDRLPRSASLQISEDLSIEQNLWQIIEQLEADGGKTISLTLYKDVLLTAAHDGIRSDFTLQRVRSGLADRFEEVRSVTKGEFQTSLNEVIRRVNPFTGEIEEVSSEQVELELKRKFLESFGEAYLNTLAIYGVHQDIDLLGAYKELEDGHFSHLADHAIGRIHSREKPGVAVPREPKPGRINPPRNSHEDRPSWLGKLVVAWIVALVAVALVAYIFSRQNRKRDSN